MNRTMQLLSLRDVASQINSGGDLDTTLRQLVRVSCQHTDWTLGAIMSIDMNQGYAYVLARHDPTLLHRPLSDRWELTSSPTVIALQRNEPVYIRDVRGSEYAGYRMESYERDYRTVLVMPMSCQDFEGRPMVLSVVSREIKDFNADDQAFLGMIVHLGAIAVERERRLEAQRLAAGRLQQALRVHTTLLEHVLAEDSVSSLSLMVCNLLPSPLIAVDFTANQVIAGRSPDALLFDDQGWQNAAAGVLNSQISKACREALNSSLRSSVKLFLDDGTRTFTLKAQIEPLTVDHELVGALVLFSVAPSLSELDQALLDSAKFALSVQMMRSFIRFRFETRTQTELFFEVIERRWRDASDLQQRAQRLYMTFNAPQQMIIVDFSDGAKKQGNQSNSLHHNATRILQRAGIASSVIVIDKGLVCMVPFEGEAGADRINKVMRRMSDDLVHYLDVEPIIVISACCKALIDYPAAWTRCRRMIDIARSFGRTGPLSGEDFGPMHMLIAAVGGEDVRAYVTESVGAMIIHDREHGTPYLETLSTYLQQCCRSQACADAMGVHVTTLRYRLARIQELFDIEVDTPERRFAIELAIRLQRVMEN
ncbi:helix-turn-helix domain-containing protein [Halotalea alkalilenta]|uniref:PucR family transcriptional regulator n=1 Tax=Halotalea alkalilenta TaxID=376489 RepID=A0A172YHP7_9GAMM|nr:helix-turn-helix domain-containing protein [Halotalea alkalilenta]ANF58779.1 PucR family transcriptional regulator [Halotalea alkalilenta]